MLQRLQLPAGLDGNVWRYANLAAANRRHRHAELELNLVTRGRGTYLLGASRYEIHRGDLLLLFPAQEHVLIEQSADFEMWIAVFRRRAVKRCAVDRGTRPLLQRQFSGDTCRRLMHQDLARIEELFTEISAACEEPGLLNAGLSYALLHAWKCFERAAAVEVHTIHPAVERAARIIRSGGDGCSLTELARQAGISASRLSRLFPQQTGATIVEFRNRQRLERFHEAYERDPHRNLLNAALEAGFGSYAQFHRVFRELVGCSPRAYGQRRKLEAELRP
jgi:AraC-like DNA-binding protein